MLNTPAVLNKAQHIANKIERKYKCHVTLFILAKSALVDTEYAELIADQHDYAFDYEIDICITPYIRNQHKYLNRWLEHYNAQHNTLFTCLGFEAVTD